MTMQKPCEKKKPTLWTVTYCIGYWKRMGEWVQHSWRPASACLMCIMRVSGIQWHLHQSLSPHGHCAAWEAGRWHQDIVCSSVVVSAFKKKRGGGPDILERFILSTAIMCWGYKYEPPPTKQKKKKHNNTMVCTNNAQSHLVLLPMSKLSS